MAIKPSPSPKSHQTQTPTPTATSQGKHSDALSKKQRAGRKEKGSRRASNAAKNENASSNPDMVKITTSSVTPSDASRVGPEYTDAADAVVPTSRRVSVIVVPKSLKRRLIERTEQESQGKGNTASHPQEAAEVILKKLKNHSHYTVGEPQGVKRLSESVTVKLLQVRVRQQSSLDQSEPIDLTKGKRKDTNEITKHPGQAMTNGLNSASPLQEDTIGQVERTAEEHLQNGDATENRSLEMNNDVDNNKKDVAAMSVDKSSEITDVESKEDSFDMEEEVMKTDDKASKTNAPKKERKRKRSERLPPKKRK